MKAKTRIKEDWLLSSNTLWANTSVIQPRSLANPPRTSHLQLMSLQSEIMIEYVFRMTALPLKLRFGGENASALYMEV